MRTATNKPKVISVIRAFEVVEVDKSVVWQADHPLRVDPVTHALVVAENGEIYAIQRDVLANTYRRVYGYTPPGVDIYSKEITTVRWRDGVPGERVHNKLEDVWLEVPAVGRYVVIEWPGGELGVMTEAKFLELYDVR